MSDRRPICVGDIVRWALYQIGACGKIVVSKSPRCVGRTSGRTPGGIVQMPRQYTPRVTRNCDQCGNEYSRPPSIIGRYCSPQCRQRLPDLISSEDGLTVRIPLSDRTGSVIAYAIVDTADASSVGQWRWCLNANGTGHVRRNAAIDGRSTKVYLHREILKLQPGDGLDGDHIDRNKLNNRRSNLRAIPTGRQPHNSNPRGGHSEHRGVSWHKARGKWVAQVQANGAHICLGYFDDEDEAAEAARAGRARLLAYAVD